MVSCSALESSSRSCPLSVCSPDPCSPSLSSRYWRSRRRMGLLPAGMRWVQDLSCRFRFFPMAGRRGGRPRRPCRAGSSNGDVVRELSCGSSCFWLSCSVYWFYCICSYSHGYRVMVCALRPALLSYCSGWEARSAEDQMEGPSRGGRDSEACRSRPRICLEQRRCL